MSFQITEYINCGVDKTDHINKCYTLPLQIETLKSKAMNFLEDLNENTYPKELYLIMILPEIFQVLINVLYSNCDVYKFVLEMLICLCCYIFVHYMSSTSGSNAKL